ncbi:30S ribosomal protein S2 [Patescibacteria group bacterium]|nr:30S ribosomal protein S2 [Patescibacteria group bacterium]
MPKIPELVELLKSGVHFGHHVSKRDPKMTPYIYTDRNQIHIIDLEMTVEKLKEALDFLTKVAATGGVVLFVASKNQARALIEKYAKECNMPYVNYRWLGGTFTNLSNILKLIKKLKTLEQKKVSGELEKYTKKEQLEFQKVIVKLNELVGGIKGMEKLPAAIYVVDIKKEKTAVTEASKKGVPIVAMVDTNVNPEKVDYPIPANDDAAKSIELITALVAEAIKEGRSKFETNQKDK